MPANLRTRPARTFWWDRQPEPEGDVLRAVIFDADSALADIGRDAAKPGLIDSVMSVFCSGIWVGVVSTRRREWVEALVRHTVGDGLVETIVTVDDLAVRTAGPELYRLALWELGIAPHQALAVSGSQRGLRAARAAALPTLRIGSSYDCAEPLRAPGYQRVHRRWLAI